jgi:hypothetical protein
MTYRFVVGHKVRINWSLWIIVSWMCFMAYANFKQIPQTTQIPKGRVEVCLPPQ